MSREELVASFTLDKISGGNAVFNTEKLDWMNAQYLARMPVAELARHVEPLLDPELATRPIARNPSLFHRLLELLRPRAKRLIDFVEQARPLLASSVAYEDEAVAKNFHTAEMSGHMAALTAALDAASPFDEPHVEAVVRGTAAERGIKAGTLIHAVRVALTGRTASPGLFEIVALLGREETTARMKALLTFLANRN
jgi:glutamyl-tRNA synthetase